MTKTIALEKIEELKNFVKNYDKMTPEEIAHYDFGRFEFGEKSEKINSWCDGKIIYIPLPNSNRAWTFAAWDYVRRFCETYPFSYPTHDTSDNTRELTIRVNI